jgi:hypothetical protein
MANLPGDVTGVPVSVDLSPRPRCQRRFLAACVASRSRLRFLADRRRRFMASDDRRMKSAIEPLFAQAILVGNSVFRRIVLGVNRRR